MFAKSFLIFALATVPAGSRIMQGLNDFLPNLSEWGWLTTAVNIYMQASALVRVFNTSVAKYEQAMDQLAAAKESSEHIWNSMERLQNVSLYDMDTWQQGVDDISYGMIEVGMQSTINTLEDAGANFIYAGLGAFKVKNALSYDSKYAGIQYAFRAYYHGEDWEKYKTEHPVDNQTQQLLTDNTAKQAELRRLKDWHCSPDMSQQQCLQAIEDNKIKASELKAAIDENNQQIDEFMDNAPVDRFSQTPDFRKKEALASVMTRIHMTSEQYAQRLNHINYSCANLASHVRKLLTGRTSTAAIPPKPAPASTLKPIDVEELCSHSENLMTPGVNGEPVSCIYAQKKGPDGKWIPDANSAPVPEKRFLPEDLEADPSDEKPRTPTVEDFAVMRAMVAYLNLQQEELLYDIEADNTLLSLHLQLVKATKEPGARMMQQNYQESMGMALLLGKVNGLPSKDVRRIWFMNNWEAIPWSPKDPVPTRPN